jgi:hypothetical protein
MIKILEDIARDGSNAAARIAAIKELIRLDEAAGADFDELENLIQGK